MQLLLPLPRYFVLRETLAVACEVNGVWHARARLDSKSYLYDIAFSRPACLFYLGAVIDPLHGKKINRIVGCAWNVDALIVRNFREKHWENMLQRGNTIHRRESCRREKVAIVENSSKKRFFKCRPNRVEGLRANFHASWQVVKLARKPFNSIFQS